ncbi:peptidase M16 family protein [Mesoterricola silvestris]|uniref:Insulinase family protein n=1 Tax=Mesoterricola silvestris TaxID=2927979 RepID=A0AA48K8A7_9BACT|nr:hypothetical protein [Mesoterricola silvestris]BDU71137.1 hypothetical protein METEAL_03110 [Mesoterricola silvestris]
MRAALFLTCAALAAAPGPQTFSLPSGLKCVLLENHDQPLLRVELATRWQGEPKPGMAVFLGQLMGSGGVGAFTRAEFNRALDDQGITFGFQARPGLFRWTLATDSRSQEPAMELLADAVFRPVFDPQAVAALRQADGQRLTAGTAADRGRARFLGALGDPPGEAPAPRGALEGLEFADLQGFRQRVLRPEHSMLVLHGDLSLSQAKELVFLHFGLWGPASAPPAGAAVPPPAEPRLLEVLEGGEAELWAGRTSDGCDPAVRELLADLLEQLPRVLSPGLVREFSLGPGQPLLVKVKAGAAGKDGLVAAFLETLGTLRTRGFTGRDLERARTRWNARIGALPLHPQDLVRRLEEGVLDPAFRRRVEAVSLADVNAALAALLAPADLRFLLLGGDAALVQKAEDAGLGPAVAIN